MSFYGVEAILRSTHNIRFYGVAEAILMSTHNIRFYGEINKISLNYHQIPSFICSTEFRANYPYFSIKTYEPPHVKTNKMTGRPATTQISLGIHLVWWESSLCTQWVAKDPRFLHADNKDSDQTGQMPRLIWVFSRHTFHFVGFVMRRLICCGSCIQRLSTVEWHYFWLSSSNRIYFYCLSV